MGATDLSNEEIASVFAMVQSQYKKYSKRGKPSEMEWTHLSAILAKINGELNLLSLASGTKCLSGSAVSDQGGDGSIMPRHGSSESNNEASNCPKKRKKDDFDIHRTGAKCIPSGPQDPQMPDGQYHTLGAFRTKPGRGEKTLSMSCSDKLAKWIQLGIQGSLLMKFLESEEDDNQLTPSHLATVWNCCMEKPEVIVDGYRQGVTAKQQSLVPARSVISRWKFGQNFVTISKLLLMPEENGPHINNSYLSTKRSSQAYYETWMKLKEHYKHWINDSRKFTVQNFMVD